jgi:sulfur carrier protein ThiS
MPQVTIRFTGPVRRPWPETERKLIVDDGTTVRDLLLDLGFAEGELGHLNTAGNGKVVPLTTVLDEGATLDVALRVGGG